MAASVFDSPLYAHLFPTGEAGRLFSDTAAIRAMLLVEGALARAQGAQGIIPELSAKAIQRATMEIQVDPGSIARSTGENGVSVPGLVAAFRAEMNAPEHAQFVHWGATSQDILDTGLMLRLRQLLLLAEADLREVVTALARQADEHAATPMAGRTYGQQATPTSWGAVLADWGHGLCDLLDALPNLRETSLFVSLSGAAGTSAALGASAAETRAALAEGLGLKDPKRSWHVDRGPILRIADWLAQVVAVLARMGATLIALSSSEIGEVRLGASGASSTMPQKQNPVAPSALQALGHQVTGLRAALAPATQHMHQRDGAAWFAEWMVLPQIALSAASALQHAKRLSAAITPDTSRMAAAMEDGLGLIHAETLSFALAEKMQRPDAQAATKELCQQAQAQQTPLEQVARAAYPDLPKDLFNLATTLGRAPEEARAFVLRAKAV
ncbi:lyase family protein [Sulfitobacter donghicola]|uniref:3-carboxy-cis,cis-muconate cycloisomerase n=1 Tax=Sulfitobacter donghicola DSW-25 = KCTC 12864 = JCM 14565 TaxID=1300350 RepID=A0A073ICM9_9RHOB|nr:lyase family protein [Sulfitobacter donghicola]KEJ88068.1 3-carboxy-cis,cis-muconate cycloisomerase [Sulfitobacter donghicola DSW-25 = KCTC 12864 = JCM 14565]KIN68713.1 putative lyase [Sulfitobacter donghicola DSW-25 = KCTC 12864 = JCM 14565]